MFPSKNGVLIYVSVCHGGRRASSILRVLIFNSSETDILLLNSNPRATGQCNNYDAERRLTFRTSQ